MGLVLQDSFLFAGSIEEIIRPRETRNRVAALLTTLQDKTEVRLPKKHNNIPL
jgi:acetyl-CoA carboxylase carboxyltransferase component